MILAIDFGEKRIGLAMSDEFESIALRYPSINDVKEAVAIKLLKQLIAKETIQTLVIGTPLGHDNKPTQSSLKIEKFTANLQKEIPDVKVVLWNETLTSHFAERSLGKKDREGKIDSEAARIILQEYIDFKQEQVTI